MTDNISEVRSYETKKSFFGINVNTKAFFFIFCFI